MEDYNNYFPFFLKEQQKKVFNALCDFVNNPDDKIFILRGYAGTGKTTLIGGFINKLSKEGLEEKRSPFAVLASTGRAAKILSDKTSVDVITIHSLIYKFADLLGDLFKYDKNGKFIFVGDPCQLPPVSQKESPALEPDYLRHSYNSNVKVYTLIEILRQKDNNDILQCAFNL